MDFLQLAGKRFLIFGVANKRSVAFAIATMLKEQAAECVLMVRDTDTRTKVESLFPDCQVLVCNVQNDEELQHAATLLSESGQKFDGLVHSVAFADYSDGIKPFHETARKSFLEAVDISCFSLTAISRIFAPLLQPTSSVVTISISTTTMASESYGYMAPIKAALDSSLAFLTKSFSGFSQIRFNAVGASLLKTSASAGIPGYVDSYLYAEKVIPRKKSLQTDEAAAVAVFLLSPRASGICAQKIIVDVGMSINYFDKELVSK